MLYIVGQYRELLSNLIVSNVIDSMGGNVSIGNNSLSFKDELSNALDNGVLTPDEATKLLDRLEGSKKEALKYSRKSADILVNKMGVQGTDTWINENSLKSKLREISKNIQSQNDDNTIISIPGKTETVIMPYNEPVNTQEVTVTEGDTSVLGIDTGISSKSDVLEDVNIPSIEEVLSKGNLDKLLSDIKNVLGVDDVMNFTFENTFGFRNYSDIIPILETAGYKIDSFLDIDEAMGVVTMINGAVKTQEFINQSNMNGRDIIKIMLDHNKDGTLDQNIFHNHEIDQLNAIENEQDFVNLLSSLGYSSKESFENDFKINYYKARIEFKSKLGTMLDNRSKLNYSDLLYGKQYVDGKMTIALESERKLQNDALTKISGVMSEHPEYKKLIQKNKKLAEWFRPKAAGVILGTIMGGGVSFDISQLTPDLIEEKIGTIFDSAALTYANGTLGIIFDKEFYSSDKVSVHGGLINGFIPYLTGSVEVYESTLDDVNDIFPSSMETQKSLSIIAGGTLVGTWGVGLKLDFDNENTKEGILNARKLAMNIINPLFEKIIDGEKFENTGINDTPKNRSEYAVLSDLVEAYGETGITFLKQGSLNNYSRILYEEAASKGFVFTGISVGATGAFAAITPLLGIHGQKHSIDWIKVQNGGEIIGGEVSGGIELNDKTLNEYLDSLDDTITHKTRYNKYSELIMNPNLSLTNRWDGLIKFANRKGKFSKELQSTMNLFKNIINSVSSKNSNEKLGIITSISQLMKKSNDMKEGNISEYNDNYKEIGKTNLERRGGFNELLGFDTDKYYDAFKIKFDDAGTKLELAEHNITHGDSFDAVASLNVNGTSIKGTEYLSSRLQLLGNKDEAFLIEIDNPNDIIGFTRKIESMIHLDSGIKNSIIEGLNSGNIIPFFYCDPDGMNDRVILKYKVRKNITQYTHEGKTTDASFIWSFTPIKTKDNNSNKPKDDKPNIESTPGEVETNIPGGATGNGFSTTGNLNGTTSAGSGGFGS